MSTATEGRLGQLDSVLDGVAATPELAAELFGAAEALDGSAALRRALSDPAVAEQAKSGLVQQLFGGKVSASTQAVLTAAVGQRWSSPKGLADAVERQGVRAELAAANGLGQLDEVSDELFRFGQTVAATAELREALADTRAPLAARQQVVASLLTGKAKAATVALAQRAVAARGRTFALTLAGYAELAAQLRDRHIAKVTVAQELNHDQTERLRAALTRLAGHQVDLQVQVDPEVIGGVRVQLGDEVIEGTIAHRLEDARRQIA